MEPWKVINSKENGPYAVETKLGWIVNGILNKDSHEGSTLNHIFSNRMSVVNLQDLLIQQYNHDFPEQGSNEKTKISIEDKRFVDVVSSSAKIKDGHYQLKLPFKQNETSMPNNRQLAEQRALSIRRKFG